MHELARHDDTLSPTDHEDATKPMPPSPSKRSWPHAASSTPQTHGHLALARSAPPRDLAPRSSKPPTTPPASPRRTSVPLRATSFHTSKTPWDLPTNRKSITRRQQTGASKAAQHHRITR